MFRLLDKKNQNGKKTGEHLQGIYKTITLNIPAFPDMVFPHLTALVRI